MKAPPPIEEMTEVPVFVPQRRCIACPSCGKGEHGVDHLLTENGLLPGRRFGPWYCDECGEGFSGVVDPSGTVKVASSGSRKVVTRCLVRLVPDVADLFFEVEHFAIDRPTGELDTSGQRYWFEEGTCVVNFLHKARETWVGDDRDPHGIFELLEERLEPPDGGDAFTEEDIARHIRAAIDVLAAEESTPHRLLRSVPKDGDPP